jgi:hypothetical protein
VPDTETPMKTKLRDATALDLCRETKVSELLAEAANERFEASGVVAVDDAFYVVFDNRSDIGCFGSMLVPADTQNRLIGQQFDDDTGYEDIACDPSTGRFFILIESLPHKGGFRAKVREYDRSFGYIASAWLDFPLPGPNKGMEGLACVQRAGQTYLLGLCEGNRCKEGEASRQPGCGRIQVFAKNGQRWAHVDTIPLPSSLPFKDYSSMALAGERLCVVSQESSALWVGSLRPSQWQVADDGRVYQLPRDVDGKRIYGNVEGVSWLSDTHVVLVSDKAKSDQKRRTRSKDQSIHLFALPAAVR